MPDAARARSLARRPGRRRPPGRRRRPGAAQGRDPARRARPGHGEALRGPGIHGAVRVRQGGRGVSARSIDTAPGWIPGSINLAIALLNDTGVKDEEAKKPAAERRRPATSTRPSSCSPASWSATPTTLCPFLPWDHPRTAGQYRRGPRHFQRVTEIDPNDATAWYWLGSTLTDPDDPRSPAGPEAGQGADRALRQGPRTQSLPDAQPSTSWPFAYRVRRTSREKQKQLLDRWKKINPIAPARRPAPATWRTRNTARWAGMPPSSTPSPAGAASEARRRRRRASKPRSPLRVKLAEGERWVKPADFTGPKAVIGRVRARFGAAVAAFDADGDGKLDLYLASAVVGPKGIRDILLLNKGEVGSRTHPPPSGCPTDRASLGVAAADFDADRHIDLFLTGVGDNRLLRNRGGKAFEDISTDAQAERPAGPLAHGPLARPGPGRRPRPLRPELLRRPTRPTRRSSTRRDPPPGLANAVYRNDGKPEPIQGADPEPAWAPLAVACENVQAKTGLSIALTPWTDVEASTAAATAPTPASPSSTSTTTATWTSCRRRRSAAGRDPQRSTRPVPRSGDRRASAAIVDLAACSSPTSTPTAAPTWSAPAADGRVLAWRNTTETDHRRGAPTIDLRDLADQRRHDGDRPRRSTWTSTA